MFNIGGGEFLVIAVIALIVLGPQRLPDAARQVGKAMGELRRLSSGFQNELKGAFDATDQSPSTGPRRDVLADPGASAAGSSNGSHPGPADESKPSASRPRRSAPLRADPVSKAPRPRSKGR